jgi:hypothetical protein
MFAAAEVRQASAEARPDEVAYWHDSDESQCRDVSVAGGS